MRRAESVIQTLHGGSVPKSPIPPGYSYKSLNVFDLQRVYCGDEGLVAF